MKRKLVSLGIFSPQICSGSRLENSTARSVYEKLKAAGFQETRWQYVYDGQQGGLVLPFQGGKNEVHIRFYSDRVFAELEIGRALLSHFFGPRVNAEGIILEIAREKLNPNEYRFLRRQLQSPSIRTDEASMRHWDESASEDPFSETCTGTSIKPSGIIARAIVKVEWKALSFCVFAAGAAASAAASLWGYGIIFLLGGIVTKIIAPSIGRP